MMLWIDEHTLGAVLATCALVIAAIALACR